MRHASGVAFVRGASRYLGIPSSRATAGPGPTDLRASTVYSKSCAWSTPSTTPTRPTLALRAVRLPGPFVNVSSPSIRCVGWPWLL